MSTVPNSDILYLYDRPGEPVYIPKGDNKVAFDVPADYLPERYRGVATQVINRFADSTATKISVRQISLPDFSIPEELGQDEQFSLFIPRHRKMAAHLIDIFMGMRTYEDLKSASVYCKGRINSTMFIYAISVAILHRPDTKHLSPPSLCEVFPDRFIDSRIIARAKVEANLVPTEDRIPITIPQNYTASDVDEEHRVAYFREDLGINLHHWHWHLVYPFEADRAIVDKDRRGELFYYMHQQILARYNFERLCNRLARVKRFNNWQEPIPEGYFPKLDSFVASRTWPARVSGAVLKDINRPVDQLRFDLQDLERWRDEIYRVIRTGTVTDDRGQQINLTQFGGIDVLGNMLEASILTPNKSLYGDLHNFGHVAVSYCHDPDHRYLENFGVMGDSATAMRDPFFYRWHAFINDILMQWKNTLPPYSVQQIGYQGVRCTDAQVVTPNRPVNELATFWQQSDVDLSRGLDFTPRGAVFARFTHLNHAAFKYRLAFTNETSDVKQGTVRIFCGPTKDERGLELPFRDQKDLMVELDKFSVTLKPGSNTFERRSDESSVTIPFERTFRNLDANRPVDAASLAQFNFCGCGWPQHMLIPKGSKEGFPCNFFVMISDFAGDRIDQDENTPCNDAASYCGIKDRKYPDARSMGYPFDCRPRAGVDTMGQFMTGNMRVIDAIIRFEDTVVMPANARDGTNSLTFT